MGGSIRYPLGRQVNHRRQLKELAFNTQFIKIINIPNELFSLTPLPTHHHRLLYPFKAASNLPLSNSWDHEIYHSLCENALTRTEILDPYLVVYKYPVRKS